METNPQLHLYAKGYAQGREDALKEMSKITEKPYIDINGVIEAFDGKIGINKAGQILRSVRHVCNGGKLDSCSLVLRSEFNYWLSIVDAKYLERLGDNREGRR